MPAPSRLDGLRRWLLGFSAALALASPTLAGDGNAPDGHYCPWCRLPYCTDSCLYGYQDYAFGRGPLIPLGSGNLQPGFRGYGVFGSPGYGLGLGPYTRIDRLPPYYRWHHRFRR